METTELVILWVICAIAGGLLGHARGDTERGALIGLLFGPFGLLAMLLFPNIARVLNRSAD